LDPRAYTPKHLADKILQSKSALEGECKQVTVLFADVKGSMELAEQVDPEEWHKILDRFFQILTDGVHRFEGTVNQYTGDGIMALFGAPIAHEDHAQRACYAALHLSDELRRYAEELKRTRGLAFAVRIGLNSGEVVVGTIGDDLRMDYTAQGHTVGLAARMEQLAGAERVYLTEHTARLVAGYFRLRDLGEFAVKGVTAPLRVHELEGVGTLRTRLDVSRARGFSRLVGRADEMAALELALKQATDGRGQVVGIVGEPGVGKSRLCFEFTERCRARGVPIYDAHCPAHGKTLPFLPMLELLRSYFGITDADSDDAARKRIAGTLVLADPAFQEVLLLVFDVLGVPDPERPAPRIDPEARQRQLFGFVRRLLQSRARDAAILLLDDVHWIDPASDAFLAQLADVVPGTHFLLALNFRPEYRAAWMGKSSYQQLPLYPLGAEAAAQLLGELLGSDLSVSELALRIAERTGGNPFFIEEVVQALVEAGRLTGAKGVYRLAAPVDEIAIPATVQAVLAARIDRLGEREKTVLQAASVIGKEFTEPVLARALPHRLEAGPTGGTGFQPVAGPSGALTATNLAAALEALASAEFLYPQALYPVAEYAFKHPLTQEVAYHSQLGERRKQIHAAVARAIEALSATKLDEQAALLAYHWEAADEPLTAADWHRRAAQWMGGRDRAETLRHWQHVRALLARVPESPETLALGVLARAQMIRSGYILGQVREGSHTVRRGDGARGAPGASGVARDAPQSVRGGAVPRRCDRGESHPRQRSGPPR
jgi:class 3 adenylate cyclase